MCGIAGRYNFQSGAPVSAPVVQAMCDRLRHRGPDGDGVWTAGPVGLGHRRLAIIDLSPLGAQPMHSADGRFTITFNGEIYDFDDVRHTLEGHGCRFRSRSDTEVILEAYRTWGVDCLRHLNGMFAFAIWDHEARRLFAARDRAGKKPFYYRIDEDGVSFASEPKAFLADPAFTAEADPAALFQYLSFQYVPTPLSAFRGVSRLPPAHSLTIDATGVRLDRYWQLEYEPKPTLSEADAVEAVLAALREATRVRLVSDVPLGAFLSGGIDSSVIVALMADLASGPVRTFSIGFDEAAWNELPYARQVAERFGTDHHELVVRPDAMAILPKLVWHYNEPYADSSAIPTMYLAEMTRQSVTVALNGDAGDENFAGYDRYLASRLAGRVDVLPLTLRRSVAAVARRIPAGGSRTTQSRLVRFLEAAADSRERRYARWMFHFDEPRKRQLCRPEFIASAGHADAAGLLEATFARVRTSDDVDTLLAVDMATYLPDDLLVKVDIATMAYGLEARSPFLDPRVMACAARLPSSLKLHGRQKKYVLKQVARRLLPASVIDRPKMGFGVPLERWFRGELRDLTHDVLLGSRLEARGYFDRRYIARIISEHEAGVRTWHYQLWNLLIFELWHRTFIDGQGPGL